MILSQFDLIHVPKIKSSDSKSFSYKDCMCLYLASIIKVSPPDHRNLIDFAVVTAQTERDPISYEDSFSHLNSGISLTV
jgi:hypothetical protein